MCGIVGCLGFKNPREYVLNGLKTLDYRGYDSAGVAYYNDGIHIYKDVGAVEHLMELVPNDIKTDIMIGHTRWATHGVPNVANTHPHISNHKKICLVHNGVIENYEDIKKMLLEKHYEFYGDTDSEIVANLIEYYYLRENDILGSLKECMSILKGSYALAIICSDYTDHMYIMKNGSPLIIGKGEGFNLVASDASPMIKYTENYIELNDQEYGRISKDDVEIFDKYGQKVIKQYIKKDIESISHDLKGYPHYMLKEIEEVPQTVKRILDTYTKDGKYCFDEKLINRLKESDHIMFIACGTSYHSSLVGGRYFEHSNKSTSKYIASEWAFDPVFPGNKPFIILISQSGETADLIHCLKIIKENNLESLILTNTGGSTLDRNCTYSILLNAGIEVSVASTKAYVAQVTVLCLLAAAIVDDYQAIKDLYSVLPLIDEIQNSYKPKIMEIARAIKNKEHLFYLGRSFDYFLSMEASLKLKEVSYIHSEAIPGGELKHGPIALIEQDTPVIVFITDHHTALSMRGNIKEVEARGAKVYVISTERNAKESDNIVVKNYPFYLSSVVVSSIAFYLAYYVTIEKGYNVDKPRNLAKSVTVE
ncbi:MAG: glutamine--fructose-6-phosphate transaminase (isomerizing) [Bacilli bacterium]|nr:glutamine--fructose-6-phosphate transaminase (isomerizing) [Bacilli bacterium]